MATSSHTWQHLVTTYLQDEAVVVVCVAAGERGDAADDGEGLVGLVDGAAVLQAFGFP